MKNEIDLVELQELSGISDRALLNLVSSGTLRLRISESNKPVVELDSLCLSMVTKAVASPSRDKIISEVQREKIKTILANHLRSIIDEAVISFAKNMKQDG